MLKTHHVTYASHGKELLKRIHLSFQPGLVHGILGPNGSGKSTLLKVLTDIWRPSQGTVTWNGNSLKKMTRREISLYLTLMPQNPQITFDFTVEEFVKMGRYAHGSCKAVEEAMEMADVLFVRDQPMTQLSQGERQRAYIARSLATEAPAMLFDEPMASLDIRHQIDIWKLLKRLARQGKTVIIANHDLQSSRKNCDCIYVMHEGECLRQGSFEEVMTPQLLKAVFRLT